MEQGPQKECLQFFANVKIVKKYGEWEVKTTEAVQAVRLTKIL